MKKEIKKFALENAVKYNGKASLNAVLGKIFSSLKVKDKNEVISLAKTKVDEVNKLSIKEREEEIKKFGEVKEKKEIKFERKKPDLINAKKGKVVMRFAPNPNGPLSFGHCRPGLWNWFLVKKYSGIYIVRMDDTDPKI